MNTTAYKKGQSDAKNGIYDPPEIEYFWNGSDSGGYDDRDYIAYNEGYYNDK